MRLVVVTPPAPIVSIEEAKAHLRVDSGDEDALITALIEVATGWLDGPNGWLGRSLGEQTLCLRAQDFLGDEGRSADVYRRALGSDWINGFWRGRHGVVLPCGPVIGVQEVSYIDMTGAPQIVPGSSYFLEANETLRLAEGFAWPATADREDAVSITYRAGYPTGDGGAVTVPAPIRHAILLMVGHLYSNRDAVTTTAAQPAQLPFGIEALLAPFRVWH